MVKRSEPVSAAPEKNRKPRRNKPLTDAAVRNAQAGDKISDNLGHRGVGRVVLIVTAKGRKTWHFREQTSRGDHRRKLGEYPAMSLAEARKAAEAFSTRPDAMRRAGTFGELLGDYVRSLEDRNAPSASDTSKELLRSIKADDPIRKREARAVTGADIDDILRRKHDNGRVTTRVNRLRSMLSAAFVYGGKSDRDWKKPGDAPKYAMPDDFNPVRGARRDKEAERTRDRVLTREEMQAFYKGMYEEMKRLKAEAAVVRAKKSGESTPMAQRLDQSAAISAFWCCVALTGQRAVQLLAAKELDSKAAGTRLLVMVDAKGKGAKPKPHSIPLTPKLAELWKTAAGAASANVFTVRGAANGLLKKVAPGATPLDLRRTVETFLQDKSVSRGDRGVLLSHGRSGVQASTYEHAEMVEQKAAWLALVEAWVCGTDAAAPAPAKRKTAKVVPISKARGRRAA